MALEKNEKGVRRKIMRRLMVYNAGNEFDRL